MRHDRDERGAGQDEADGQQQDRAQVGMELAPGREPRRGVDQRREEKEEDQRRIERDHG